MHLDKETDNILVTGRITNPGSGTAGPGNHMCNYALSIKGSDGSVNWSRIFSSSNSNGTRQSMYGQKIAGFNGNVHLQMCPTDSGAKQLLLKFSNESPPAPQTVTFTTGETIDIYAGNISGANYGSATVASVANIGNPTQTNFTNSYTLNMPSTARTFTTEQVKI